MRHEWFGDGEVIAVYREFGSLAAPRVIRVPAGETLTGLAGRMTTLPADFGARGVICVNGHPVPRASWGLVRPKARAASGVPVEVTFHAVPMGGGGSGDSGGKNILAIVASIAITALTGFVAGGGAAKFLGAAFAKGTIGATLLAAGVSLAGSLLISALVPPPTVPTVRDSRMRNPGAASAEGNVLEPNGPVPRVIGRRKVYPPLACEPLTYFDGPDEVVEAVYALAGPHELADIRVGAAPVASLANVDHETREGWPGDARLTLVTRQARTEVVQTELRGHTVSDTDGRALDSETGDFAGALPQSVTLATRDGPDEHWLHLTAPAGLNRNASETIRMRVPLRVRLRLIGASVWTNLPELHLQGATPRQLRLTLRLIWTDQAAASPDAPLNEGWVEARRVSAGQTAAPTAADWTADAYFGTAGGDYLANATIGTAGVLHTELTRHEARILLDTATFPKGRYEVEVVRGAGIDGANYDPAAYTVSGVVWDLFGYQSAPVPQIAESRDGVSDQVYVLRSVSVWNAHPVPTDGCALIAVRARNRQLDRVSTVAGGKVKDWDGTAWADWVVTDNPAPHLRDIWTGAENLDPVPIGILDDAGLLSWRAACIAEGFRCNALIEDATVDDAARIAAACGYAKPLMSDIWGVVRDYDRSAEAPVQVFTPRNSSGFEFTRAFARAPEGFRVNFRDAARDYDTRQITVFRAGVSDDTGRLEQVTYEGIDAEAEARARAAYDLAQVDQRSTFYSLEAPVEAVICRRGDLVGVAHDSLSAHAGSGRVTDWQVDAAGAVTALALDSAVPLMNEPYLEQIANLAAWPDLATAGLKTGVAIRRSTGSVTVHQPANASGASDVLSFTPPLAAAGIDVDTLVAVGPRQSELRRLIVFAVAPKEDLTATLTLVDEAPGLFA